MLWLSLPTAPPPLGSISKLLSLELSAGMYSVTVCRHHDWDSEEEAVDT
jgi:hypothetical protein